MLGRENLNANNHHQGSILFPSKQFPMDYLYPPSTNAQSMSTNLHPSPPLPPPLYSGQNVPGYYLPSQTQTTNAKLGAFSMDNRYNEKPVNMANYNQMPSGDKITISRPDINTDSSEHYFRTIQMIDFDILFIRFCTHQLWTGSRNSIEGG